MILEEEKFIEQAEHITANDFARWECVHPREKEILKKIYSQSSKLIIGPRGCGKSTLLIKAKNSCLEKESMPFPVYVNFKFSLKLEPFYRKQANASFLFKTWVILKILSGTLQSTKELTQTETYKTFKQKLLMVDDLIDSLEAGDESQVLNSQTKINVEFLIDTLNSIMKALNRNRTILLLDDAAHAFSPEQQKDFFDIFRAVRTSTIAPKASIYPGITNFSAEFNFGHDAEPVDVWLKPSDPGFLDFMRQIAHQRFDSAHLNTFLSDEYLEYISYSSFGIPRGVIYMIGRIEEGHNNTSKKVSQKMVTDIATEWSGHSLSIFESLKYKLPRYSNFIERGDTILGTVIEAFKHYNADKSLLRNSVSLALTKPVTGELSKILEFYEYSGLIYKSGHVSRGEKGHFDLYTFHYGLLSSRNAISVKKTKRIEDFLEVFRNRNAHEFTRLSEKKILQSEELGQLSIKLPPCQRCGTLRVNETAKFCSNCGAQLTEASIYNELIQAGIDVLPITNLKKLNIVRDSDIRVIQDILLDVGHRKLLSVDTIGKSWAKRIHELAEEFLN